MKWEQGAKRGTIVAGTRHAGASIEQLSYPNGVFVDSSGRVYVAEEGNHRVTR